MDCDRSQSAAPCPPSLRDHTGGVRAGVVVVVVEPRECFRGEDERRRGCVTDGGTAPICRLGGGGVSLRKDRAYAFDIVTAEGEGCSGCGCWGGDE